MRRIIVLAMFVLMILCIITGIVESRTSHTGTPAAHILMAVLFIIVVGIHIWLNRKAVAKYLWITK
jgi:hypothetical protein